MPHPKVFDRDWRGKEGALGKRPACPCSWVSCGSRRHEVSTSCGRDGSGWTAHAQGGTHALEEKEERDGSMSMPCNDVIHVLLVGQDFHEREERKRDREKSTKAIS